MKAQPTSLYPFKRFIFRTPLFPWKKKTDKTTKNSIFDEAVFLASPELYEEKKKQDRNQEYSPKMNESLYKYEKRINSRATPFGLFAGCSIGEIRDTTGFSFTGIGQYKRSTRLDMDYMCAIAKHIEHLPGIREQLTWFTNDTIYKLGGKYRYIECIYNTTRRTYKISSVDHSEELESILKSASAGCKQSQLIKTLCNDEIQPSEAEDFINEIINAQLLKSELEINITGENALNRLLEKIEPLENITEIKENLKNIWRILTEIDSKPLGSTIEHYQKIMEIVKTLGIPFNPKYLFQSDLFKPALQASISEDILNDIYEGIQFLNRLSSKTKNLNLNTFKKAFIERYEEQEIPLLQVMDTEAGIGYIPNKNNWDTNELIDDIKLPSLPGQQYSTLSNFDTVLLHKIWKTIQTGKRNLTLQAEDFNLKPAAWHDMPEVLSVFGSIFKTKENKNKIFIKVIGGSGANLLSRFSHLDSQIWDHADKIMAKEQELNNSVLIAEIIHLPEARIGNIIFRPLSRKYEIPYLANGGANPEYAIPLKDLTISVKNNRVILRSIRLNREILPFLTTAHNYPHNSMPIYHFLCDLQYQNKCTGIAFSLNQFFNTFEYLPQIEYKNTILSRQKWKIKETELKHTDTKEVVSAWRKSRHIPRYVVFAEQDNELLIDFNREEGIKVFLSILKKYKQITIEEFLFNKYKSIIETKEGTFCNEFLFTYYQNK